MNDDIGLDEDIEPSEEATEDVKGGAAVAPEASMAAASLASGTPTKAAGVGGAGAPPITKMLS